MKKIILLIVLLTGVIHCQFYLNVIDANGTSDTVLVIDGKYPVIVLDESYWQSGAWSGFDSSVAAIPYLDANKKFHLFKGSENKGRILGFNSTGDSLKTFDVLGDMVSQNIIISNIDGRVITNTSGITVLSDSAYIFSQRFVDHGDSLSEQRAEIGLNSQNILLRVKKDSIISYINISPESVDIAGSKITLNGDVTVLGSFTLDGSAIINQLQSDNYTSTTGSKFDLTNGIITLGGSATNGVYLDGSLTNGQVRVSNGTDWSALGYNGALSGIMNSNGDYWYTDGTFQFGGASGLSFNGTTIAAGSDFSATGSTITSGTIQTSESGKSVKLTDRDQIEFWVANTNTSSDELGAYIDPTFSYSVAQAYYKLDFYLNNYNIIRLDYAPSAYSYLELNGDVFISDAVYLSAGTTSANGIKFGNDVSFYRSGVDILKTDDTFDALYYKVNGSAGIAGQVITSNGTTGGVWANPTGGGATNLSASYTTTSVNVNSDTGGDATIVQAVAGSTAGVMSGADKTKLDAAITDGNTNWNNTYGFITDGNTGWDNSYGFITGYTETDPLSDNYGSWTLTDGFDGTTIGSGQTLTISAGTGIGTAVFATDQMTITNTKPSDNNFTTTLKNKLDGITAGADNYGSWTLTDGFDGTTIGSGQTLTISAGTGLTSAVFTNDLMTLAVEFAGSGSATTASRSDHSHNSHTSSGSNPTGGVPGDTHFNDQNLTHWIRFVDGWVQVD